MSKYYERAEILRATKEPHYNCAQSVMVPFAEVLGLDEETVFKTGANFGSGMRIGATCGAVTGALMTLGMAGVNDPEVIKGLMQEVREKHEGILDCAELLRVNNEKGGDKKRHCDDMVYELLAITERILREKGIIKE